MWVNYVHHYQNSSYLSLQISVSGFQLVTSCYHQNFSFSHFCAQKYVNSVSSSSNSWEDGSDLSSNADFSEVEDSEGNFIPYDEELEPIATQEEAAAYEANRVIEEEQELKFQRRFAGEVDVSTW